jgi:hypothetical protein
MRLVDARLSPKTECIEYPYAEIIYQISPKLGEEGPYKYECHRADLTEPRSCSAVFVLNTSTEFMKNYLWHTVQQKSSGLKFRKSRSGSDVTYSSQHNSSSFTFPVKYIRGVSLSSIHYNQSRRLYINRIYQHTFLI